MIVNAKSRKFIETLVGLSNSLLSAYEETVEYWKPDEPPITTLFGAMGDRVADDFDLFETDVKTQIFHQIEMAMASGDEELATAVGTGLIEAIVGRTAAQDDLWKRIAESLGILSLKHAQAWRGG